ncbi:MAG: patatin-like phospholipase family protein [Rubrivivax sp.]|nr:patatin-like phospholipase family protein [Rubrivivax sp.]
MPALAPPALAEPAAQAAAAFATLPGPAAAAGVRPRVALVLSGGGARGFAHLGVLKVLHEYRVPVDLVWGTSMGAVVGGAYAAGRSTEELEQLVRTIDWVGMFDDRPPRETLSPRRREEDILLPSRVEFALNREGLSLPPSTAGNAALELALARLLPEGLHQRPSRDLPIPFGSVASDILTGAVVNQAETPVFQALRASLSVPGVFSPVRVNQRLLVDGGLVRNLPVDLARAAGAEVIIAVNVGTPLNDDEKELGSSLGVMRQMLALLTEQNVTQSLSELTARDLLITPELGGVGFLAFKSYARAERAGAEAARRSAQKLQALSLSPEAWAEHLAAREALRNSAARPPLPLASVRASGVQKLDEASLAATAGLRIGQPVTTEKAYEAATRLYGDGHVSRVAVAVNDIAGERHVTLQVDEAEWARSRLRLGLEMSSDFRDSSAFTLAGMHVLGPLNRLGAEWRTVARIGSRRELTTEWWQPLAAGSPWFGSAVLDLRGGPQDVYRGNTLTSRVSTRSREVTLQLGRQLGGWGELRLGASSGRYTLRSLLPVIDEELSVKVRQWLFQLRGDTLDSLGYPTSGHLLGLEWQRPFGGDDGDTRTSRMLIQGLKAFSWGPWSGHVYGERGRATGEASAPLGLGGFWRLTGLPLESLQGQSTVLGRLVLARELAALPPVLGRAVRAGFSLEAGNALSEGESLAWAALRKAGSLFLSADTRFGPVYLAVGGWRGQPAKLYLFLGPIW